MLYRFFVCALISASFLRSQTLDTGILGTVVAPSGATIANVSLTIIQLATGLRRTVMTAADGKFEIRYLLPGEYTVEAQAAGFRTERRTGIVIQIGQQARIDFTLQVAGVSETVEVRSST